MIAKINCAYSIAGLPEGETEKMTLSGMVELFIKDVEAPLDDGELFSEVADWTSQLFQYTLEEQGFASKFNEVDMALDIQGVNYLD